MIVSGPARDRARAAAGLLVLALAVAATYGGTLHVPWYLDDNSAIVENPAVRDLGASWRNLLQTPRGLAFLTFALNYRFGGTEVAGYHLVNVAIHLASTLVVFALFRRLLPGRRSLALVGALVFAVHPLQTQAVTYVVQRMTSLSGFFVFLAVLLFLQARDVLAAGGAPASPRHVARYGGALLAGLLAVLIKENAIALPLALFLVARLAPSRGEREGTGALLLYLLPFVAAPAWLTLQEVVRPLATGASLLDLGAPQALSSIRRPQPLEYLFTEFPVYWLYLRLFFYPAGQALDYGYPIVTTLWNLRSLLALGGLAGLAGLAWAVRRRLPLVALGTGWFFVSLAVESTVIPLDPVFEHRMYVPLFGVTLALLDVLDRIPVRALRRGVAVMVVTTLGVVTWQRNALWADPTAFFEANLRVAPRNERVAAALAGRYREEGRPAEAEALLRRALELNPGYAVAYDNLAKLLIARGELSQARELLRQGVATAGASADLLTNLGSLLDLMGESREAERMLRGVVAADPGSRKAHTNLGVVLAGQQRWDEAIACYRRSLELLPGQSIVHFNLGVALANRKRLPEAREQFLTAAALAPGDADALLNAALVSVEMRDVAAAAGALPELRRLDAAKARELERELAAAAVQRDPPAR